MNESDIDREFHPSALVTGGAAAAGHADQPHLARECRALTGLSPGELIARKR